MKLDGIKKAGIPLMIFPLGDQSPLKASFRLPEQWYKETTFKLSFAEIHSRHQASWLLASKSIHPPTSL